MDDGYKNLWAAVLKQAVADAQKYVGSVAMEKACVWFRSESAAVGSFLWICNALDLDSDSIKLHSLSSSRGSAEAELLSAGDELAAG